MKFVPCPLIVELELGATGFTGGLDPDATPGFCELPLAVAVGG